jgi:RimJ/RimL family protein N-acetyltransferase
MQDPELQKATASEPLTLSEEYAMQTSWREDADKLTFIACTAPPASLPSPSTIESQKHDTPSTMIGDVNLFLTPDDEDEDEDAEESEEEHADKTAALIGEIEIMIAAPTHQNRGLGHSILLTFLWYITSCVQQITDQYSGSQRTSLKYLRVKIDKDNLRSIKLFEKAGFEKVSGEANYFGEVELRWAIDQESIREIEGRMESVPVVVGYR